MMSINEAVEMLSASPAHRILKKFEPRAEYGLLRDPKVALMVDVESTGLDTDNDRIIQFAGVRFEFDAAGNIGHVGPMYASLEDPGMPLPETITELTGITAEQLVGQRIDDGMVEGLLADVVLVIAHNAEFDRRMVEGRFSGFDRVAWACSQRDVKWEKFGVRGAKLDYLLMMLCDEFHEAHGALQDCLAGIHVLATPRCLPGGKCLCASDSMTGDDGCPVHGEPVSPFQMLLESVRTPTVRIFARNSPFETKDTLRARHYRWQPDPIRCWTKDVRADEVEAERAWLRDHVYPHGSSFIAPAKTIARRDYFSARV